MMKILQYLLFFLCVNTALFSQSLLETRLAEFPIKNLSVSDVLEELSSASGIPISYSKNWCPPENNLSFDGKDVKVGDLLEWILEDTPLGYKVTDNDITIIRDPKYWVSGTVRDSATREPLIGAHIWGYTGGGVTNNQGDFKVAIKKGVSGLEISYTGYKTEMRYIVFPGNVKQEIKLNIFLKQTPFYLNPVECSMKDVFENFGKTVLSRSVSERLPGVGGTADILQEGHKINPGSQSNADGIGGHRIRGGSQGQNLVLLDGVRVYNPYHLLGLVSIFNNSSISYAELMRSNFPARYGGGLSSIMDIRTRNGNNQEQEVEAGLNLFDAYFLLEGPIVIDSSSFILTARHSLVNGYIKPFTRRRLNKADKTGGSAYKYYDVNAKFNFALSQWDKLFINFYKGGDEFSDELTESLSYSLNKMRRYRLGWGNDIASAMWYHEFKDKRLFSSTRLTYSKYSFDSFEFNKEEFPVNRKQYIETKSAIQDYTVSTDFDYYHNSVHFVKFGGGYIRHAFQPGVHIDTIRIHSKPARHKNQSNEFFVYAEDEIKLDSSLQFNIGLRATGFAVPGKTYWSLEPRFYASYQLFKRFKLFASVSKMNQYLHMLTTSNIVGLPTDLWVSSTDEVAPQQAWQFCSGFQWQPGDHVLFSAEGYYKKMNRLIKLEEYTEIGLDADAENWDEHITVGQGWSYGAEFMLEKKYNRFKAWTSYTLSWATRQFDDVNDGAVYPFRFDRRHNFKTAGIYTTRSGIDLSANWVFASGLAYTAPEAVLSNGKILWFPKNSNRMLFYHRLDFALSKEFTKGNKKHKLKIGVYNTYHRGNALYYRFESVPDARPRTFEAVVFPIFPFFNYSVKIK